jgi:hypothetical protein
VHDGSNRCRAWPLVKRSSYYSVFFSSFSHVKEYDGKKKEEKPKVFDLTLNKRKLKATCQEEDHNSLVQCKLQKRFFLKEIQIK